MITAKLDPIRRDLDVAINGWLGPDARAAILADKARQILDETDQRNLAAFGQVVAHETFVDGQKTEVLERVRPDGVITRVYDALPLVLMQIGEMLWKFSPVRSGAYQQSHHLLVDGSEIAVVRDGWQLPALPKASLFTFVPGVPYARPIERGWSKKAPDGVYHVVAEMLRKPLAKLAKIEFNYREFVGLAESAKERAQRPGKPRDMRQPCINVRPT